MLDSPLPNRYATGRLVLGIKDSGTSSGLIAWAVAQAEKRAGTVVVLHTCTEGLEAMPDVGAVDWFDIDAWPSVVDEPAETVAALLADKGVRAVSLIHVGEPAVGLVTGLHREDEIAVGHAPGSGWRHVLGNNVVHQLVAAAPCPIVIVPRNWKPSPSVPGRVVIAWDGTPQGDNALEWALQHCARITADLVIARVVLGAEGGQSGTERLDSALVSRTQARASTMGDITVSLLDLTDMPGGIALALDNLAGCADALVLGTRPLSWLSELTQWDTAERAIAAAECPVVIVPPVHW